MKTVNEMFIKNVDLNVQSAKVLMLDPPTRHRKSVPYFDVILYTGSSSGTVTFSVPSWTDSLATDADGTLFAYAKDPQEFPLLILSDLWDVHTSKIKCEKIAKLDFDGKWKDSLVQVG